MFDFCLSTNVAAGISSFFRNRYGSPHLARSGSDIKKDVAELLKDSSLLFSPGIVEYGIIIGDFLRTVDLNKPNLTESFVDTVLGKRVIDLISKQACGFRPFYNLGIFTSAIKIGADIADIIHYQAKKNEYRPKPAPLVTNCSAVLCKLGVKPELVENYLAAR